MRNKRIVIVTPDERQAYDTFVFGPYGRIKAWFVAYSQASRHPWSLVQVVSADSKVTQGQLPHA